MLVLTLGGRDQSILHRFQSDGGAGGSSLNGVIFQKHQISTMKGTSSLTFYLSQIQANYEGAERVKKKWKSCPLQR